MNLATISKASDFLMTVRSLLTRIAASFIKSEEGQARSGPWSLPITGGILSADAGQYSNWWQLGYDVNGGGRSALVEACVSAYAQTVAMCPGDHWRLNDKGGRERVRTSALSRLLRKPNLYQSISDFMLNITRSLYTDGNAYALALRNDRFEIDSLHMMDPRQSYPQVASTGDVFYRLSGNDVIDRQIEEPLLVPHRDVLHIRLHSDRRYPFPLKGESPLTATALDIGITNSIINQQMQLYNNQARPSAVLTTDLDLDKEQVQSLRDRWNEQVKGLRSGGVPILTHGLKVSPWTLTARDSQLADMMKFSEQHIALAFRIPLQILGVGGGTSYATTELLMQSWVASGLGFALNHIEEAFGFLFQLKGQPDEYVEFDTGALLRSAQRDRIEALTRAVQGGILAPNEARAEEGLEEVPFGDEPRVQQQVVPLSAAGKIPSAPGSPGPGAAPGAPGPGASAEIPPSAPPTTAPKDFGDDIKRETRNIIAAADRIGRRRLS